MTYSGELRYYMTYLIILNKMALLLHLIFYLYHEWMFILKSILPKSLQISN